MKGKNNTQELSIKEIHEKILYSVVRVRSRKAGGSGTVIYSKPDPKKPQEYQSFVMTCSHVIEDSIVIKEDWDSILKKNIRKEFMQEIGVEVFDYVYLSRVNSSNSHVAQIVAYDKPHDIALLKLDSPKEMNYVAKLVPREDIENIKLFTPIWTSGCSLLHDPFANSGHITYLKELIENKLYWMCNGAAIFGNSGGAVFLAETGEQIGITARLAGIPSDPFGFGFAIDWMTWMNFMVPPSRIYEFLDQQDMQFIYDPKDTFEAGMKRREKKQKRAQLPASEGKVETEGSAEYNENED